MAVSLAVSVREGAARIALLDGDVLREYAIWRWDAPDGVGDVCTGRVTAKMPAMAGCFVEIGGETGFLLDSAGGAGRSDGDFLAVRIARAAQGGKGPRLQAVDEAPGEAPGLIRRGPGPLVELAERFPSAPVVLDDYALMARLRPALEGRMRFKPDAFDAVLEDEVAGLALPTAPLPGGARMHVTAAPAVTAIDVDSGAAAGGHAALNEAVMPELVRQMVLRNLSGGIIIDFAGMKPRERTRLAAPLTAALAADFLRARLLGFSNLGFAEIVRPRVRPPLHEMLRP
jgi:hypothetical protein